MNDRKPMATPDEVAEFLRIEVATLHQWRWRHIGPKATKVGRFLRYRWADIERWLDEQNKSAA